MGVSAYIARLRAHVGTDLLLPPGVSAVVQDDTGRVLLQRRSDNGRWSLPSGVVDDWVRLRITTTADEGAPSCHAAPGEKHPALVRDDAL
jgi:hypothetical protein